MSVRDEVEALNLADPRLDPVAKFIGFKPVSASAPITQMECHYCKSPRAQSRDHIVPRDRGGQNRWWNLAPACILCNAEKGNGIPLCDCAFCHRAYMLHVGLYESWIQDARWHRHPTRWQKILRIFALWA